MDAANQKRLRLLEAAGELFRTQGYRAVSMEAAAAAAGVSKVTLYKSFPGKEALFKAVADTFTERVAQAVKLHINGPGAPSDRVGRALAARHKMTFEFVDSSPHAQELMSAKDRHAHASVAVYDEQMRAALASALDEDPTFRRSSALIARALFHGSVGISNAAQSVAEVERDVLQFVEAYLIGLRILIDRADGLKTQIGVTAPLRSPKIRSV